MLDKLEILINQYCTPAVQGYSTVQCYDTVHVLEEKIIIAFA